MSLHTEGEGDGPCARVSCSEEPGGDVQTPGHISGGVEEAQAVWYPHSNEYGLSLTSLREVVKVIYLIFEFIGGAR